MQQNNLAKDIAFELFNLIIKPHSRKFIIDFLTDVERAKMNIQYEKEFVAKSYESATTGMKIAMEAYKQMQSENDAARRVAASPDAHKEEYYHYLSKMPDLVETDT